MDSSIEISKLDTGRRQLETALELYFRWADPISIHTLAAASRNVLSNLYEHRGAEPTIFLTKILQEVVKPEHHKMLRQKFREPENFFKHADRDPDETFAFQPEVTQFWLLEAIEAYTTLTHEQVPIFKAFRAWWMIHHRELLSEAPADLLYALENLSDFEKDRVRFIKEFMGANYAGQS